MKYLRTYYSFANQEDFYKSFDSAEPVTVVASKNAINFSRGANNNKTPSIVKQVDVTHCKT